MIHKHNGYEFIQSPDLHSFVSCRALHLFLSLRACVCAPQHRTYQLLVCVCVCEHRTSVVGVVVDRPPHPLFSLSLQVEVGSGRGGVRNGRRSFASPTSANALSWATASVHYCVCVFLQVILVCHFAGVL